jgi:C-terminal processing protease CtpA/Prc
VRPGLGLVVMGIARQGAAAVARRPKPGDVVTRVNGQPLAGLSLDAARDLLRASATVRLAYIPAAALADRPAP